MKYIWRDLPGHPVVPQVVLVRRRIEAGARGIGVGEERVLQRLLGSEQITAWVRDGAPLAGRVARGTPSDAAPVTRQ